MLQWIENLPVWFWLAFIVHGAVLGTVAYLILLERKTASWVQDRIGPNRVGPWGLLQPMADGLKFILKEDYRPAGADRVLFSVAPMLMILVIIVSIAVLPWGGTLRSSRAVDIGAELANGTPAPAAIESAIPFGAKIVGTPAIITQNGATVATVTYDQRFQIADLNIGVLFILAVLSLAVYGVVIGGWASNNKYSFLGGLRATANMVSYEIPLALAVLTIVIMYGTLDLGTLVERQSHYWAGFIPAWNVFAHPLTFVLFLVCIHAEANRAPFDVAEAEQELVGGYHTEYSSMRFALFFMAEYAGMVTTSAVCVALFFGGWHLPWLDWVIPGMTGPNDNPGLATSLWICIARAVVFFGKTILILFIFMWTRWSLPRFRFDQVMMLAWRGLIPVSLGLLLTTAVVLYLFAPSDARFVAGLGIDGMTALMMFLANGVLTLVVMVVSTLIPAAPKTNRRVRIVGSRFDTGPDAIAAAAMAGPSAGA